MRRQSLVRLATAIAVLLTSVVAANAQLGLSVTVHLDEAGTLFQKIQAEIEELGELDDITSLTVSGRLNRDDQVVLRDQLKNLFVIDFSGIDPDCSQFMQIQYRKRLKSVVLPTAATELASGTLYNCDSLTTIVMPPGLVAIPNNFASGCRRLPAIDIPQSVTAIGSSAFAHCDSLKSVTIPAGVTEIQQSTFSDCVSLSSVTFLNNNVVLRNYAFNNTGFETFTLPVGMTISGDQAFGSCRRLTSFTFPDGLTDETQVGTGTFAGCSALTQVRLPADLTVIPHDFFNGTAIPRYTLPATIRRIDQHAFWGAQVEEFDWPAAVTTIQNEVFRSCEKLKRITIPETVDSIGPGAFLYCSALESIHLPEGIRTLTGCFSDCTSLKDVNIPSTVTYIGRSAFSKCKFTSVDIPDHVTYIGWAAFSDVPLEGEIKLPSKLKGLGGYAFNNGNYERVVVPEGCLSIGGRPFYSNNLKVVDLPSTLLTMDGVLLGDNTRHHPDSVIMRAMVPPFCKNDLFFEREKDFTLYVPQASVSLYKAYGRINVGQAIESIDVSLPVLTITDETIIDQNSGLQQGKYDVEYYTTWGKSNILEQTSDHHPRMMVGEGATFHAGTIRMNHVVADQWWFTQYKLETFINRGNTTADKIDLCCKMGATNYFTPPYDVRMSDIVPDRPNTPFAIYRYNSAARAAGNFNTTWERVGSDETLISGQGYAFRGAETMVKDADGKTTKEWTGLHLINHDGGTDNFLTTADVTVPLQHYSGEFAHNRNWNFVGMPYPAYLDIRGLDYDGPILAYVSDGWNVGWKAYSALDDEVTLAPMAGLFIQAPDGVSSITFDADRRQLGATFVKGNAANNARAMSREEKNQHRTVYNLSIVPIDTIVTIGTTATIRNTAACTRFVINPQATTGYDIGRDAPVMAADSANLLYTHAGGVAYAINERPLDDGIIRLAMQIAKPGKYTLSLAVKEGMSQGASANEDVWLIDNEEHTRTLLTDESYTFTADAGSHPSRFVIAIGDADPTAISETEIAVPLNMDGLYDLGGRKAGNSNSHKRLFIENGRKFISK